MNSNIHNKLYRSHGAYTIDTRNSVYIGAIRDVNKKIYFQPDSVAANHLFTEYFCNSFLPPYTSYNSELLLYDFDVSIGDTGFTLIIGKN